MPKLLFALGLVLTAVAVRADQLLPTAEGTAWEYDSTETFTGTAPVHTVVTVRAGKELFEGTETVKLTTVFGDGAAKTELLTVSDRGVICLARSGKDGKMAKLDPPETMVAAPLKSGVAWDLNGEVLGNKIHEHFTVVGEENVTVPAGRFRAFHFQCEDNSLMSIKLDRWFVPGTGLVKETTVVRGPGVLQRVTLELQKFSEVVLKPQPTSPPVATVPEAKPVTSPKVETAPQPPATTPAPTAAEAAAPPDGNAPAVSTKKLTVEVSSEPSGGLKTRFKSTVPNLYVRWHGRDLPKGATIRVAWVAEDVGDIVEPNFIIDETESTASTPDASARFTLGRPPDGWAEGKYRLEFYIDDVLEETIKVTIEP
jgi:hypothetical protein